MADEGRLGGSSLEVIGTSEGNFGSLAGSGFEIIASTEGSFGHLAGSAFEMISTTENSFGALAGSAFEIIMAGPFSLPPTPPGNVPYGIWPQERASVRAYLGGLLGKRRGQL